MDKQKTNPVLQAWTDRFQVKVITYLRDNDIQRQDLARRLGIAPGTISKNLKPGATPSIEFIEKISLYFSDFSNSLTEFFKVKSGTQRNNDEIAISKSADDLLDEKLAAVTQLVDEIKDLAEEIRRDQNTDDTPDNGKSA